MIPMACPNCGRRGNVPVDRLNSRLHCKKCDAVFHLDSSGRVVLGEPGGKTRAPRLPKVKLDTGALADAFDSIKALSLRSKALVAVGLVAFAGYFALSHSHAGGSVLPPGVSPDSLEGRTTLAAEAFVSQDTAALRRMAASGTEGDLDAWYSTVRPFIGDYKKQEPGYDVSVSILSMGNRTKTEGATSSAETDLIFPAKPGETRTEDPYKLRLSWKCEKDEWRLDGTTLRNTAPQARKR
jgi:hypothetical protein